MSGRQRLKNAQCRRAYWGDVEAAPATGLLRNLVSYVISKQTKDNSKHPKDNSKHPTDNSKHPADKSRHQTSKNVKTSPKSAFSIGFQAEG